MLLIPLLSPQGWDYVLLLATPAILCVVDRWRETKPVWNWVLAAAIGLMCLSIFDIMGRTLYGRFMALSIVSVCALVIAVGLVHLRWRKLA
jgi:membrane protein YdbS with pleckstrin-like domain